MHRLFYMSLVVFMLFGNAFGQIAEDEKLPNGEYRMEPYVESNENAGGEPIRNPAVLEAFGGPEGVQRVVDRFVDGMREDPRTGDVMRASDPIRLRRTLGEQFTYLLGAEGAMYSGRNMRETHIDHGITTREFNAAIEVLQKAMDAENIPFRMQNKLLSRLAPMHREIVTR